MTVDRGDILTLEVSKIVHGGYGLGRVDGRVVFVPGSAPGDVVEVIVTDVKKSHAFADVVSVIQPSPHRVPHVWPEADVSQEPHNRPGGADFGHLDLDYQRRVKTDIVREALARQGDVSPDVSESVVVQPIPGRADGTGWRTRITLHVDESGVAGQRAFRSHRVIPTQTLPLAHPDIQDMAAHTRLWPGEQGLHIGRSSTGGQWLMMAGDKPAPVTEQVAGHTFQLNTEVFWQVHESAAEVLTTAVVNAVDWELWEEGAANHDLYGGVGLFTVALAHAGGSNSHLVSVESHDTASAFARQNVSGFANASTVTSDVMAYLRRQVSAASGASVSRWAQSTIVLDPPRSGAGASVIDSLAALAPHQVVYVACDPVAFARDQKLLAAAGYGLTSLEAFDLFPHTHHIEMVAGLRRENG
jgi:tRNA/tmRNA/rRNA uracil-C5-methylase (TrmA/RlmC/RlmD family)